MSDIRSAKDLAEERAKKISEDYEKGAETSHDEDSSKGNSLSSSEKAQKYDEVYNQLLRAKADLQNVQRRKYTDIENARRLAVKDFMSQLLPFIESFDKALESSQQASADDVRSGLSILRAQVEKAIQNLGVEEIDPLGEVFDPELHEAVTKEDNATVPNNSIVRVFRKGYVYEGMLLSAAKVVIAQGGPEPEEKEDVSDQEQLEENKED